jgi:hypothetical protein
MRHTAPTALDNHHDHRRKMGGVALLRLWAACGILLCCATWNAHAAAAEHLLIVFASNDKGCGSDPAGNTYFAEAWGYDAGGNIVCESAQIVGLVSQGIVALSECHSLLGNAVTHAAALTTRNQNNTYAYVSTVLQSGRSSSWTAGSTQLSFSAPASCGGGTITVQSVGVDTTSN